MHDIAQKQIFFYKLPELDPDPDLVVNFPDPDSGSGSGFGIRIRIRNTDSGSLTSLIYSIFIYVCMSYLFDIVCVNYSMYTKLRNWARLKAKGCNGDVSSAHGRKNRLVTSVEWKHVLSTC
jgi:hypothetical protein